WKLPDVNTPRAVVIDLDPGAPADVLDCGRVALELRELLEHLGMIAVVKTSGGKGLHISVPLNSDKVKSRRKRGTVSDDGTKEFELALGKLLVARDKKRVTVE